MHQNITKYFIFYILAFVVLLFITGCAVFVTEYLKEDTKSEEIINEEEVVVNIEDIVTASVRGNTVGNISNFGYTAYQDGWIYYRNYDDNGNLYKVKTDGTGNMQLNEDPSSYINVVGNWIYYTNQDNNDFIYKIKIDGSSRTQLNDERSHFLNVVDNIIYYSGSGGVFSINTDGSDRNQLNNESSRFINVVGDWIYYCMVDGLDEGIIRKVKIDGTDQTTITEDMAMFINVVDDWIYYFNASDGGKLYKIRADGSDRTKLNNDGSFFVNVADGWIYYGNANDSYKTYRIGLDGEGRSKINDDVAWYIQAVGDWIYFYNWSDSIGYRISYDGSIRQRADGSKTDLPTSEVASSQKSEDDSDIQESVKETPQVEQPSAPSESSAISYVGTWKNVKTNYDMHDTIDTLIIKKGSGHYIFDYTFTDGSGMQVPATYGDGYFTIQMPGYTWSAHYDSASGYLVINYEKLRKVN